MTDLDDRFRSLKRTPAPDLWSEITDRPPIVAPPTRGARRWVAATAAALVAVAGFAVAVVAFRSEKDVVGPPSGSPVRALRGEIAATFAVGEDPRSVVYGGGSVWVAVSNNDGTFGGRILRIDPVTNETIAEISVETIPTWEVGGGAMVVEGDNLWITGGLDASGGLESPGGGSDTAVTRIDVATNEVVDLFTLGGEVGADLAFVDEQLWVLLFGDESVDHRMEVARVDAASGDVLARIPLSSNWGHAITAAGGRVLVNDGGRITSIDPATNAIAASEPIRSSYSASDPVVWRDELWASLGDAFVRFDTATGKVIEHSSKLDPTRLSRGGLSLEAADERGIWFLGYNGIEGTGPNRLVRFEPATDAVTELVTLNEGNPIAMAIAPNSVWILNHEGKLTRVDLISI
jgi:hypothetical protein